MSKSIFNLVSDIRNQLPNHPTTWGIGVCGHSARGCRTCIDCLHKDLEKVVGAELADEYISLEKRLNGVVSELYNSENHT